MLGDICHWSRAGQHGPPAERGYPSTLCLPRGFLEVSCHPELAEPPPCATPAGAHPLWQQEQGFPADPAGLIRALVPPPHGTARAGTPHTTPNPPPVTPSRLSRTRHGSIPDFPRRKEGISALELRDNRRNGFALPGTRFLLPSHGASPSTPAPRTTGISWGGSSSTTQPQPALPGRILMSQRAGAKGTHSWAANRAGTGRYSKEKGGNRRNFSAQGVRGGRTERHGRAGAAAGEGRRRGPGPICSRVPSVPAPAVPPPGAPDSLQSYRCHLPLARRRFGDGRCLH